MKFDIVTFGSAVVDVFVDTDVDEKKGFMCYPTGSKILLKNLRYDLGGGGTNTAVAFSRVGLRTGCICKVGDDVDGTEILNVLKKEKVQFLGRIDKRKMSGYSIILDSKENNRTVLTYKGANDEVSFSEIKKFETKWIYFSSVLGESLKTQRKLAEMLVKKGVKLAFNPSEYLIKNENINSLLKLTEVLILNKEEAEMLAGKGERKDLLEILHKKGPRVIVITDRDREIRAYDGKKKYFLMPHRTKAVERTGAGDAFSSGFVAGIISGKSIDFSLRLGLRESESVIRYFGAKNKLLKMKLK